ncbi:MAG: hypothetical protein OXD34_06695 [bacterium]|nr:hypothetical protein [bacterium]
MMAVGYMLPLDFSRIAVGRDVEAGPSIQEAAATIDRTPIRGERCRSSYDHEFAGVRMSLDPADGVGEDGREVACETVPGLRHQQNVHEELAAPAAVRVDM